MEQVLKKKSSRADPLHLDSFNCSYKRTDQFKLNYRKKVIKKGRWQENKKDKLETGGDITFRH